MARTPIEVPASPDGLDAGKVFVITPMSAWDVDRWSRRVMAALVSSGANLPEIVPNSGLAGLAAVGFRLLAFIEPEKLDGLLDALIDCVSIKTDRPEMPTRPIVRSEIQDYGTIPLLHREAFQLHKSAFTAAVPWISLMASAMKAPENGEK